MNHMSDLPFGLVLRPDRRQIPDRRQEWRGGRRASDGAGFAAFSTAREELPQTGADKKPAFSARRYTLAVP